MTTLSLFPGAAIVPKCPANRCAVGRVRPQDFPPDNGALHLRSDSADDHKHVVVLRDDQHQRRVRRHLQRRIRVRRRRHGGARAIPRLRTSISDVCRQHGRFARAGRLFDGALVRFAGSDVGDGRRDPRRLFHIGSRSGVSAGEGSADEHLGKPH